MARYLKYVLYGVILMAPQELIVAIFKGKPFKFYLMALAFWAVMLSIMFGISRLTKWLVKHQGLEVTLSAVFYMMVAFSIEWGIIGNSPWQNPGANQPGLVAGWVSVFILPRVFLEDTFGSIRTWIRIWYVPFVLSIFLPVWLIPGKGPIVGIIVYGYSVIPFLFLSVWYICATWRTKAITIREMRPEEAAQVSELVASSVREGLPGSYPADVVEALARANSTESVSKHAPKQTDYVLRSGVPILAMIGLKRNEIGHLFVHPKERGKGLGRMLVEFARTTFQDAGYETMFVLASLNAVGFYGKCGFTEEGRGSFPIGDGLHLDFVRMTRSTV
ncbi:GNAT family N-acetyltransferase [Planctomycetota bacterium]